MEPITHVAIRFRGVIYSLPAPNRHHHVIWMIARQLGISHVDEIGGDSQGFLDASGKYLNRVQALEVALHNKQVKDPNGIIAGQLFSEDVW